MGKAEFKVTSGTAGATQASTGRERGADKRKERDIADRQTELGVACLSSVSIVELCFVSPSIPTRDFMVSRCTALERNVSVEAR